jgi:hypothetical protein
MAEMQIVQEKLSANQPAGKLKLFAYSELSCSCAHPRNTPENMSKSSNA